MRRLVLGAGAFLVTLWLVSGNSWLDIDIAAAQQGVTTPNTRLPGALAPQLQDFRLRGLWGTEHVQPNADGSINVKPMNKTGPGASGGYTCATASGTLIPAGPRQMLAIDNESASSSIAINFGGTAVVNSAGSWTIPAGMTRTWTGPFVPSDAINCITAGGSGTPVTIQVN